MRAIFRSSVFLLGLLLAPGISRAEKGILFVKVMDLKNNPVRGVSLALEEPGCVALGPSDDRGVLRIKLAPGINPQNWVTLELTSARYALLQPYDRRAQVPAFENEAVNYLRVFLMSIGDRAALENGKFAVQMAAQFNAKLTPQLKAETKSEAITEEQRKAVLDELAASVGLKSDEIDQAIRAYSGKTADPYEVGVIALYERDYAKATAELTRSYEMREQALDKAQEEMVAVALSLGQSLHEQGHYREAAVKFQRANALKPDDAVILNWLGLSLYDAGQYVKAEPLYKRALEIREKALGKDHLETATSLNNLASLYESQGKYAEAEPLHKRALEIREKALGKDHSLTAASLNNLALLYDSQGRYAEAEPLLKRALEIKEKALGKDHPSTATSLNNLASLYYSQGKYAEAEPLYKRTLAIFEAALGPEHPNVATVMENYAVLLRKMNREDEAARLEARAKEIRAKAR
jgi:tetratricopeptide (TPR) repeat protein